MSTIKFFEGKRCSALAQLEDLPTHLRQRAYWRFTMIAALVSLKWLLAQISVLAGVFAGSIAALDFFLTKSQKNKLGDLTLKIWMWLDDQRPLQRLDRLKSKRVFRYLASMPGIITGCLLFMTHFVLYFGFIYFDFEFSEDRMTNEVALDISYIIRGVIYFIIVSVLLMVGPVFRSAYSVYEYALTGSSVLIVFLKIISMNLFFTLTVVAAALFMFGFATQYLGPYPLIGLYILLYFALIPLISAFAVAGSFFVDIIYIGVLTLTFRLFEIFVRKVAESEKGVVIGASIVLTTLGNLLKPAV